jgi:hypothetical protein
MPVVTGVFSFANTPAIATGVPAAIDCPLFLVCLLLLASLSINNTPAVASAAAAIDCPLFLLCLLLLTPMQLLVYLLMLVAWKILVFFRSSKNPKRS